MWQDQNSPGCMYDTVDCTDCGGCKNSPLKSYLEEIYQEHDRDYKITKVIIIKSGGPTSWYKDKIGKWFTVRHYNDSKVVVYDVDTDRRLIENCIMKEDALTIKQLRELKLKRVLCQ